MKKFQRLPPEMRKEEIQAAALELFREKGYSATTMENIVSQVSLSKGGVYRLYPSTTAILSDLMLKGMRLRNVWYMEQVRQRFQAGEKLDLAFLVEITGESLLLYPDFSSLYAEFLWEKQRDPELQKLYEQIYTTTVRETQKLMIACGAEQLISPGALSTLTDLMNSATLSLHTLGLRDFFVNNRKALDEAILSILTF